MQILQLESPWKWLFQFWKTLEFSEKCLWNVYANPDVSDKPATWFQVQYFSTAPTEVGTGDCSEIRKQLPKMLCSQSFDLFRARWTGAGRNLKRSEAVDWKWKTAEMLHNVTDATTYTTVMPATTSRAVKDTTFPPRTSSFITSMMTSHAETNTTFPLTTSPFSTPIVTG